ncbi:hypothetical protein [Paenibacillus sp. 1P07SE]|uniref:hypothetical protein n=1 Tax=Paenibacillus sp. 1P07SE TaxID=3132209 RepID=UPI0039A510BE
MDLKRDQKRRPKPRGFSLFLLNFIKKLMFIGVFVALFALAIWAAYTFIEPVRTSFDALYDLLNPMIERFGWWPVLGGLLLFLGAGWALLDEMSQKEKRRQQQLDSEWR